MPQCLQSKAEDCSSHLPHRDTSCSSSLSWNQWSSQALPREVLEAPGVQVPGTPVFSKACGAQMPLLSHKRSSNSGEPALGRWAWGQGVLQCSFIHKCTLGMGT